MPYCSVCRTRYNEEERVPLLLQCGHGFCKECLSRMFSASPDTKLACPRCRHVSVVGNSVQGLRKNYAILALIQSNSNAGGSGPAANNFDCDYTDDEDDDEEDNDDDDDCGDNEANSRRRCSRASRTSSSGGCGPVIEVGVHQDLKLVKMIGEGRQTGVEMWAAVIGGGGSGRCRHRVAVKKVTLAEETSVDWVLGQLENLRRASMWCRNVCAFHGVTRMEGSLGLVMDRCYGSVQSEMQRNEGRLTLEQILRFFLRFISFILLFTIFFSFRTKRLCILKLEYILINFICVESRFF